MKCLVFPHFFFNWCLFDLKSAYDIFKKMCVGNYPTFKKKRLWLNHFFYVEIVLHIFLCKIAINRVHLIRIFFTPSEKLFGSCGGGEGTRLCEGGKSEARSFLIKSIF